MNDLTKYYINGEEMTETEFNFHALRNAAHMIKECTENNLEFELNGATYLTETWRPNGAEQSLIDGLFMALKDSSAAAIYRDRNSHLCLFYDFDDSDVRIPLQDDLFGFIGDDAHISIDDLFDLYGDNDTTNNGLGEYDNDDDEYDFDHDYTNACATCNEPNCEARVE